MQVEALKEQLVKNLLKITDIQHLKKVEEAISANDILESLQKPMRDTLDIEQLKVEQNYEPINKAKFIKDLQDLDIQEPIEELLKLAD